MTRRAICFDLDGTLVDSLPDIIGSIAAAMVEHGLPDPGDAPVRALVGRPLEDMFATLSPGDLVVHTDHGIGRYVGLNFANDAVLTAGGDQVRRGPLTLRR